MLDWFAARNAGDDAGALALFADTFFFVDGSPTSSCNLPTPCVDRDAALQGMQPPSARIGRCFTVTSIAVNGSIVTGRFEVRTNSTRANGIERQAAAFMAEVREGKIVSLFNRLDLGDPLTALNAAINAGTAAPLPAIPAPAQPCS